MIQLELLNEKHEAAQQQKPKKRSRSAASKELDHESVNRTEDSDAGSDEYDSEDDFLAPEDDGTKFTRREPGAQSTPFYQVQELVQAKTRAQAASTSQVPGPDLSPGAAHEDHGDPTRPDDDIRDEFEDSDDQLAHAWEAMEKWVEAIGANPDDPIPEKSINSIIYWLETIATAGDGNDTTNAAEFFAAVRETAAGQQLLQRRDSSAILGKIIRRAQGVPVARRYGRTLSGSFDARVAVKRRKLAERELRDSNLLFAQGEGEQVLRARQKEKQVMAYQNRALHVNAWSAGEGSSGTEFLGECFQGGDKVFFHPRYSAQLQQHQKDAVCRMWARCIAFSAEGTGFVLAHCMGLGKTISAICLAISFLCAQYSWPNSPKHCRRVVVISPPALVTQWAEEFRIWTEGVCALNPYVVKQRNKLQKSEPWFQKGGLLILNVQALIPPKDSGLASRQDPHLQKIFEGAHLVILDECHKFLANPKIRVAQALGKFQTLRRIGLSGSPIQNHVAEIFHLMAWVVPGVFGTSVEKFQQKFVQPIEKGLDAVASPEEKRLMQERLQILRNEMSTMMERKSASFLAYKVVKVAHLEFILHFKVSPLQAKIISLFIAIVAKNTNYFVAENAVRQISGLPEAYYRYLVVKYVNDKEKQSPIDQQNADSQLALIEALDKVFKEHCPAWIPFSRASAAAPQFEKLPPQMSPEESQLCSPKFQWVLDIIDEAKKIGDRVVLFTVWAHCQPIIVALLRQRGTTAIGFSGVDSDFEKRKKIKEFNDPSSKIQVFVATTKAGSHGVNLSAANRVILFEPVWNPADQLQAAFRVFRIGQAKSVYVYHFIAAGTGEKLVEANSLYKKKIALRLVDDVHSAVTETDKHGSIRSVLNVDSELVLQTNSRSSFEMAFYADPVLDSFPQSHPDSLRLLCGITPAEVAFADDADEAIPEDIRQKAMEQNVKDVIELEAQQFSAKYLPKKKKTQKAVLVNDVIATLTGLTRPKAPSERPDSPRSSQTKSTLAPPAEPRHLVTAVSVSDDSEDDEYGGETTNLDARIGLRLKQEIQAPSRAGEQLASTPEVFVIDDD